MAGRKGRRSWLLLHSLRKKRDFLWIGTHETAWQLGTTDCKEKGDHSLDHNVDIL